MPDIHVLLRDKLWGPLSWGKLSSFFSVVSALMCFDPWVWELPSLTLLRYMALTFHTLPYLIIPTHSYRNLSLTLFHPNDFFPCPRLPNNTYPPLLYRKTCLILFHPTRSLVYHTQPVSLIPYSIFIKYPILPYPIILKLNRIDPRPKRLGSVHHQNLPRPKRPKLCCLHSQNAKIIWTGLQSHSSAKKHFFGPNLRENRKQSTLH